MATAVVQTQSLVGQLLAAIGAPTSTPNIAAMTAWLNSESTHTASTITAVGNNPLNISTGADVSGKVIGTTAVGPGIAQYSSVATGVQATAQYLTARQPNIIAGFKTGTGTAAVTAITASNYVTGGNGGNQYGGNLLGRYQGVLSNLVSSTSSTTPSGGASTPLTATPSQTNPGVPTGVVKGTLSEFFGTLSPTHTLNAQDILNLDIPVDNPNLLAIQSALTLKIGTPINQIALPTDWSVTPNGGWQNFWGGQAGANGSGGGFGNSGIGVGLDVPGALTLIGIIAVGAVLILTGGIITLKRK